LSLYTGMLTPFTKARGTSSEIKTIPWSWWLPIFVTRNPAGRNEMFLLSLFFSRATSPTASPIDAGILKCEDEFFPPDFGRRTNCVHSNWWGCIEGTCCGKCAVDKLQIVGRTHVGWTPSQVMVCQFVEKNAPHCHNAPSIARSLLYKMRKIVNLIRSELRKKLIIRHYFISSMLYMGNGIITQVH